MMANLLYAPDFFVGFDAEELEQSIPRRFETQLAKRASCLAIQSRKHALSYEQLNSSANVIAREILNRRGKGSEPIALLLENDAPMIEAILGVLKAGKDVRSPGPFTSFFPVVVHPAGHRSGFAGNQRSQ